MSPTSPTPNPEDMLAALDTTSAAEREQMARKHVLCVNGSSVFLDLVRELLEDVQYNVTTTNFVPLTFDLIGALRPDLVIIDVVVGIHAGWELLDHLAHESATRRIPVIVTSTNQTLLDRAEAIAVPNGSKAYLAMPFDIDAMLAMVNELIGDA